MTVKIFTVVGARPQFVKAAVVSRVLRANDRLTEVLVHTGQHYDAGMSDVFFEELDIPRPDYHLEIGSCSHGMQTGRMLEAVERALLVEKPDCVLVYGDTNSTLAGALAAAKLCIPVAHVEAGMRSFNPRMPEEINRVLSDHVCSLLLVSTKTAGENLLREGLAADKIERVGDVMYDAALLYARKAAGRTGPTLGKLGLEPGGYVLATVHRAENTDDPLRLAEIFEGLKRLSAELPVVFPVHPRTRRAFEEIGLPGGGPAPRLQMIPPVGYLDMVALEKNARLIVTDSGGVQKEAFFYRVPCLTVREETEWVELIEAGWNRLVGAGREAIVRAAREALGTPPPPADETLYGNGKAGERVVDALVRKLNAGIEE